MMKSGIRIIKDDPLTGVGPDMVIQVYPHYRDKTRGQPAQPAPAQRAAADRGRARPAGARRLALVHRHAGARLPAAAAIADFPSLSNAGLAAIGAMLAAGLFEYNFGDSEFLMLFLVLVTLPYAAERGAGAAERRRSPCPPRRLTCARCSSARAAARCSIVGDLMLDHFVIGRVDRISPEAPVPVVQFDHESYRLGGAANVAHNVAALGGTRRDRRPGRQRPRRRAPGRRAAARRHRHRGASSPTASAARRASCASSRRATSRWRGSTTSAIAAASGELEAALARKMQRGRGARRRGR